MFLSDEHLAMYHTNRLTWMPGVNKVRIDIKDVELSQRCVEKGAAIAEGSVHNKIRIALQDSNMCYS